MVVSFLPSGYFSSNDGVEIRFETTSVLTIILEIILVLLFLWIELGMLGYAVRRLHDSNHTGWWLWIDCIPFGWIFLLYFLILPSVERPVKWGTYLFINED